MPSLLRLRHAAGLLLFSAGAGAGWMAARHHTASAATVVEAPPVTPVAVELTRLPPAASGPSIKHLSLEGAPQGTGVAEPGLRLSSRQIANHALEWTVFLRGDGVYGAGVVLDDRGHVLTCDHVIDGLKHVDAYFDGDSTPIPAAIVARAGDVDLALLQIPKSRGRASAPRAAIADVAMGDAVFAIGAPRKMPFSMSHGIVSYVGRSFDGTFYVQTDLTANAGSSGGPILNERGEVIGLSSFILRGGQGLTFAVPVDYAYKRFATELGVPTDAARFDRWLTSREAAGAPRRD